MNLKTAIISGLAVLFLIISSSIFGAYVTVTNTEVELRNKVVAQDDVCKSNFDKYPRDINPHLEEIKINN